MRTVLSALTLSLLFATSAHADTTLVSCYTDADGDGYASDAAPVRVKRWVTTIGSALKGKHVTDACPAGSAPVRGDCDDARATVHPYTKETWNSRDDDCDGDIDEPYLTAVSYTTSYWHTRTSVRVRVQIPDRMLATTTKLRVKYSLTPLDGSAGRSSWMLVDQANYSQNWADVQFTGLKANTVYEVQINEMYEDWTRLTDDGGNALRSDPGYVMTAGWNTADSTRHGIVRSALGEYQAQLRGDVGYEGRYDEDGTRYGASPTEAWCSEFYGDMAGVSLNVPTRVANATNTSRLKSEFGTSYITGTGKLSGAKPGDWVHLPGHSAMLLGVDGDEVWVVEGNAGDPGNRVNVRAADADDVIGVGQIPGSWL